MNLANIADGEFPDYPTAYPANDTIPATIEPLLELIFHDWGPELLANAELFDAWVRGDPSLPAGHVVSLNQERKVHPTLGPIRHELRGRSITRDSAPHGLWHFARAAAFARALTGEARGRFDALLQRTGGREVMAIALARPLERKDHVLVLG